MNFITFRLNTNSYTTIGKLLLTTSTEETSHYHLPAFKLM